MSQIEQKAILSLPFSTRVIQRDRDVRLYGEHRRAASVVAEGVVARYGQTRDGQRQFVAMHLPGDMADLCSVILPDAAFGLQALADAVLYEIALTDLLRVAREHPGIAEAFWRDCVADSSLIAQQVVRLGRLDARARLANVLCEIACRLGVSSRQPAREFSLPLTQTHLGEMLGLTSVHINRTVRTLREQNLAVMTKATVVILDWRGLAYAGEFEPAFLQFKNGSKTVSDRDFERGERSPEQINLAPPTAE